MTRKVLALKPDDSILETITTLLKYDFDGIPVVDANRKVLGVVAERDLLYRIRNPQFATIVVQEGTYCDHNELVRKFRKMGGKTAQDVMDPGYPTILEGAPLEQLVEVMIQSRADPIPVVNPKGELTGIVSRTDVLKIVRELEIENADRPINDEEITHAVLATLRHNICLPITGLHVRTQGGRVILKGEVEHADHISTAEEIAMSIRGVKEVENDLIMSKLLG